MGMMGGRAAAVRTPEPVHDPDALPAITTNIPARLDRLPWTGFHFLVVAALGITWILDGLEVTIVGSIGPMLRSPHTLGLSMADIGTAGSAYLFGAILGALFFGRMTDQLGRRAIFTATLAVYIAAVFGTACSWNAWSFILFRAITGFAIGGEYAAINSTIDELIPARVRGRVDLIVNGSFWIGAAMGAVAALAMTAHGISAHGWRFGFAAGGVLAFGVLFLRHWVPESPRWLVSHGRAAEAEAAMRQIEQWVETATGRRCPPVYVTSTVHPRRSFGYRLINRTMMRDYKLRSALALSLMAAQAFLYNAVFFTYAGVLDKFEHVPPSAIGWFILPLAVGNVVGPLALGPLFDTVGRRRMIFFSYGMSAVLMLVVAALFAGGHLTATTQTAGWMAIFFFASPAASAAYLTASEIFPLEARAVAISVFYVLGTLIGGLGAPYLFARLIELPGPVPLALGYVFAAALMLLAGLMALFFGVDAENKSLEQIARPLSG